VLQLHTHISDGIDNTSYFVTTARQVMVLTLFETHSFYHRGHCLDLMAHLSRHAANPK